MPTGIYKRTEYHINKLKQAKNLGRFSIGHIVPQTWRKAVSMRHTGRRPTKKELIIRGRRISEAKKGKPNFTQRGENNNNWKGGKTPLIKIIRTAFEYKLWRTKVFERDRFTCVHCGLHSGLGKAIILHADHIKPFSIIMHEYDITSIEKARSCLHYGI
ncbi:MAG: HNH endonuclease [Candidatus Pacearchaeota archaeon]